jgi:hypothetical protein
LAAFPFLLHNPKELFILLIASQEETQNFYGFPQSRASGAQYFHHNYQMKEKIQSRPNREQQSPRS